MEEPEVAIFDIIVSEDKTEAWIQARGELPGTVTVETVLNFLKEQKISYGLVDASQIEQYLSQKDSQKTSWKVAQGRLPKPGADARLVYHFDKDPLKIGTMKSTGIIDFKDKGEIAQVQEGALLLEKIPMVKEADGKTVYGQPIPAPKAQDISLVCGENTKLSSDGLRVNATKSGRPVLAIDGSLSVYPELEIKGDVGFETGHVQFKGFINVQGAIQPGFQVRGDRLAAKEICKADVEVDGDIIVDGGIIGSRVIGKGNIKARYIHSSTVEAPGDLIVEKEVLHSTVEVNGIFIAHQILSTQVSAKRGVKANQIGSEASKPCSLLVGVDSISKKFIQKLMQEISGKEEAQKRIRGQIEQMKQESNLLSKDIGQLVQVQDRGTIQQRSLKKLAEQLRAKKDLSKLAQVEQEIKHLDEKMRAAEEPLVNLMDKQTLITEKISELNEKTQALGEMVKGLHQQIQSLDKGGESFVQASEWISSDTTITGQHSYIHLAEDQRNVLIKEKLVEIVEPEEPPRKEWRMVVSSQ